MKGRPLIGADNIGRPCTCLECQAAGVTHLPIVRVPADERCARPHWLHGEPLKRYHEARARLRAQFKTAVDNHGIPGSGDGDR